MESALTSLGVYVLIDLISLAIIIKYRKRFEAAVRIYFHRVGIMPIVNNYNTYNTYGSSEENDRIQAPALYSVSDYGDANVTAFNEEEDEEDEEDLDYNWGYDNQNEDEEDE